MTTWRAKKGRDAHLEGQAGSGGSPVGPGGTHRGQGGVGRPTRRAGRGREALPGGRSREALLLGLKGLG